MDPVEEPPRLRVSVAYSPSPGVVDVEDIELPPGSVLADAVRAVPMAQRHGWAHQPAAPEGLGVGVWAKLRPWDHPLRDGDRVELYRPLKVDPKEARRQRYRRQGRKGPSV